MANDTKSICACTAGAKGECPRPCEGPMMLGMTLTEQFAEMQKAAGYARAVRINAAERALVDAAMIYASGHMFGTAGALRALTDAAKALAEAREK